MNGLLAIISPHVVQRYSFSNASCRSHAWLAPPLLWRRYEAFLDYYNLVRMHSTYRGK
jgi:hypothetical protein